MDGLEGRTPTRRVFAQPTTLETHRVNDVDSRTLIPGHQVRVGETLRRRRRPRRYLTPNRHSPDEETGSGGKVDSFRERQRDGEREGGEFPELEEGRRRDDRNRGGCRTRNPFVFGPQNRNLKILFGGSSVPVSLRTEGNISSPVCDSIFVFNYIVI